MILEYRNYCTLFQTKKRRVSRAKMINKYAGAKRSTWVQSRQAALEEAVKEDVGCMKRKLKHKKRARKDSDSNVKKWFGWLGLLFSLLSGWLVILTFFPRIAVTPGNQLVAGDIFSTAFNVKNDGFLSFYDVGALCALGKVVTQVKGAPAENTLTYQAMEGEMPTFGFRDTPFKAEELQGDASLDVPCAFGVGEDEKVKEANIKIIVIFRPYYMSWWYSARIFTFGSVRDPKTGDVHWVSRGAKWLRLF